MEQQSKLRRILFVFGYFARIGAFTFGGGWSIIAQMQRDFVDRRGWLTEDDLMDMTSIGRSLPGVMIGNVSFMFGYRMAGVPGGVAAVLGMNLAPFLVLALLTNIYAQFCANAYVIKALGGIRASVLPIIGAAVLKLRKSSLQDAFGWIVMLAAFCVSTVTGARYRRHCGNDAGLAGVQLRDVRGNARGGRAGRGGGESRRAFADADAYLRRVDFHSEISR